MMSWRAPSVGCFACLGGICRAESFSRTRSHFAKSCTTDAAEEYCRRSSWAAAFSPVWQLTQYALRNGWTVALYSRSRSAFGAWAAFIAGATTHAKARRPIETQRCDIRSESNTLNIKV